MADCCTQAGCEVEKLRERQTRILVIVFAINAVMFVIEFGTGLIAGSTSLLADSLDMLGDSLVYGFSLFVVAKNAYWKALAALLKSAVMALFGFFVLAQVGYKLINPMLPQFEAIGLIGALALMSNLVCFILLWRHRGDDVNMRSVWICSRNDIIANAGVLLAALGVWLTNSQGPDILIGSAIAALFLRSAWLVFRDAQSILATPGTPSLFTRNQASSNPSVAYSAQTVSVQHGSPGEVFLAFSKLGLTSFGGPIAHLGYFHREFVERRCWLNDSQFAQLLALCQFLPGPASSQVSFSLGLLRAGGMGAVAAFVAFSLPSAAMMFAFAEWVAHLSGTIGSAAIHGLKLIALAVVAQGVLGMIRKLCPDTSRASIAALAAVILLISGSAWMQLVVIALGAVAGLIFCRHVTTLLGDAQLNLRYGALFGWILLSIFLILLVSLPLLAQHYGGLFAVTEAFYHVGALVFGGGHVVLPLLEESVVKPGWIAPEQFLAGYGAAQAVPGPLFTLAAFLGASLQGGNGGLTGAGVALAAIFLPGFLLIAGMLPLWRTIARYRSSASVIAGINAAVVGVLGAALYDPVWTSSIRGGVDVATALVSFMLLAVWRTPVLLVVLWSVLASVAGAMVMQP